MEHTLYDLEFYVNVAQEIFDTQTGEELQDIKEHFGVAFKESKIVAMIAVKLVARIVGIREEPTTSGKNPFVERLADRAFVHMYQGTE